ncbi:hypothetical protein AALO_G00091660 [Alosa alosa]|uniref:C2H2-type domain-containing protein n=1 Tax=Alosa alosa TaxID=278164 RepID=A0AAV6GVZ2_9TELE|nr:hypothetical protein AALO_G00091660 [Alosa alosa]
MVACQDEEKPFAEEYGHMVACQDEEKPFAEEYGHMIACQDEEKPFAEFHCKTETDITEFSVTCKETQTTVKTEEKKEEDVKELDYLLGNPVSLAQMNRVSVVLVDCCRPQGRRGEEEEMQTNGDAHQIETKHPHITQQNENDELSLQFRGRWHHCTVCRKSFTALTELEQHQQTHSVSVDEKRKKTLKNSHQCTQCGKAFKAASNLRLHMLTHTGEKPHKCVLCGKGFSQMSNLRLHMLIHTGEKPHKCDQCESAFAQISNLRRHMFKHTRRKPHKCDECGQLFLLISNLQFHALTHTEEEPHGCVQCGEAFITSTQLQDHMAVHTHVHAETDLAGPRRSGSAETDRRSLVKEEEKSDEGHDHVTGPSYVIGQDEDESVAELHCKSDEGHDHVTGPSYVIGQDEDESVAELHCKSDEGHDHVTGPSYVIGQDEDESVAELHCKTERDMSQEQTQESNVTVETPTTEIEAKKEEGEQELDYLLGSVSEHPYITKQKVDGQNDKLILQLSGRLHHCRKSFKALTELEQHQQTHTLGVNEQQNTGGKKTHFCGHCGRVFKRPSILKQHLLTHTGEKPHQCVQCGKAFSQASTLKTHMQIHTGEKTHECVQRGKECKGPTHLKNQVDENKSTGKKHYQCGKAFTAAAYLQKLTHTGVRPHKCDQCGKAFSQLSHLKSHILSHTGERPHKCDQCGKAFSQLSHLKTHIVTHTGVRPHKCDQCGKAFSQLSHLKTHIVTHTGERPHKCDQCGRAFSQLSHLKSHILSHTGERPHKCDQCGRAFSRISILNYHMLTHTRKKSHSGEKPHECAECGKAFRTSAHLLGHMVVHSGERPHVCSECGMAFSYISGLKAHMLTMHTAKGQRHRNTETDLPGPGRSGENMDLPLSSCCVETEPVDPRPLVKEDTNEEERGHVTGYGRVIAQDDEEKPFAELHCRTETDVTDSNYESLQTTVKMEVKIEEDEHDYLLESYKDSGTPQGQRGKKEEMETQTNRDAHQPETSAGDRCSSLLRKGTETETGVTETLQTAAKTEEKKEEDEHEHGHLLGSVSEHPDTMQQKIHGDNDELNLQLKGRMHHCRKSFMTQIELEQHQQQKHSVGVNEEENSRIKPHEWLGALKLTVTTLP